MKLVTRFLRTPVIELRSALSLRGLRTREDYDELVYSSPDCDVRLSLSRLGNGQLIRCFVSVAENRLLAQNSFELFNEIAFEGHPVVAYGMGRGQATFEFEWLHPDGSAWRISAERVEILMQRLSDCLGPKPRPARQASRRRFSPEILDGVLAHAVNAA